MTTIKRVLVALLLLLGIHHHAAAAVIGFGTEINVNVDMHSTVIYMETDATMMLNPHNPSTSASSTFQLQVHPASPLGDGIYFAYASTTLTFGHGRGYQVEIVVADNGVRTDPYVSCLAFPGDHVSWYYYGNVSPSYVQVAVDNASGVMSGPCNQTRNYTPAHAPTIYLSPQMGYKVDTASFNGSHNCIGDMPASNLGGHLCEQSFFNYIVTANYSEYFPLFVQPTYQNPGLTPAGCNLNVSSADDGYGNIYSYVDTYGY